MEFSHQGPAIFAVLQRLEGDNVAVETYDAAGQPRFLPFTVLVAC